MNRAIAQRWVAHCRSPCAGARVAIAVLSSHGRSQGQLEPLLDGVAPKLRELVLHDVDADLAERLSASAFGTSLAKLARHPRDPTSRDDYDRPANE